MAHRPGVAPVPFFELRIHGVHGTPPEAMLGTASVDQVGGDGITGIWRPKDRSDLPRRAVPDDSAVEAYSWSGLTSGVSGVLGWVTRALWMLLLPFALGNVAYWARLELGTGTTRDRVGSAAARVFCILLTLLLVLGTCFVSLDLLAWQCFAEGAVGCPRLPEPLHRLGDLSQSRRLALAALVPLGLLAVLWWLSRQSLARYEEVEEAPETLATLEDYLGEAAGPAPDPLVVRHPDLWRGSERTRTLQRLHLAAGIAVVVGYAASGLGTALLLLLALLLLVAVVVVACRPMPHDIAPQTTGTAATAGAASALLKAALGLVAILLAYCWLGDPAFVDGDLRGHNAWFVAVFALMILANTVVFSVERSGPMSVLLPSLQLVGTLVLLLLWLTGEMRDRPAVWVSLSLLLALGFWALLVLWQRSREAAHAEHAWGGAAAAVLLGASAWTGLLFTTATTVGVADWLNGGDQDVRDLTTTSLPMREPGSTLVVTGDLTLRDGVVAAADDGVRILSGTLEVATAGREAEDVVRYLSSRRVGEVTVSTEAGTLVLDDSCVQEGGGCDPRDEAFVNAGSVSLGERTLQLGKAVRVVTDPVQRHLVVPQVLIWVPLGQLAWVLLAGLALGGCLWRFRSVAAALTARPEGALDPRLAAAGLAHHDATISPEMRTPVAAARRSAALAHRAERLLHWIGLVTTLVLVLVVTLSFYGGAPSDLWSALAVGQTLGLWLAVGASAALVLVASRVRTSLSVRKAVGVLWDLSSFWPRAAHPLAPPCYAERVVPEVSTRLRYALDQPGLSAGVVVVSAHSQGSLIAVTTLSRLTDDELGRVRLVTYGSQVRALYGRVFPRVFGAQAMGYSPMTGPALLGEAFPDLQPVPDPAASAAPPAPPAPAPGSLRQRLGADHWRNLFRRGDYLGYRVFSDLTSPHDLPVLEVPVAALGDPGPHVLTHSDYPHSPEYGAVLRAWTGEPAPPGITIVDYPPVPLGE